ncbi:MAG: AAA-like domain-containing protein [Anaerolineae bacterium]|nr:AAA-like domain-containing protein [Anaerolineae bacterium]
MNITSFKTGGPLTDDHAAIYIERQADHDILTHLWAMNYLLVIEPRQQGKTSLINHLMDHSALNRMALVYVYVNPQNRFSDTSWYQSLCSRILHQLRKFFPCDQWPSISTNSVSWRDFLYEVGMQATTANWRIIIALDEIGALNFEGSTEFFSVLRDVYNSRKAESEFQQLTFLLSGTFHPRDLIQDSNISPFNIAHRVRLKDFNLEQVCELVSKGPWSDKQIKALAQRIYYWTDGQPYLTQLLCSYLKPNAIPTDVDTVIEHMRIKDENHLPPILKQLSSSEKLRRYVERILDGEQIRFYPQENQRQSALELLGVIKEDTEGFCVIRNRIYKWVFKENEMFSFINRGKTFILRPKPQNSLSSKGTMNIKHGLERLKACLSHSAPDSLPNFLTLEARWNKNKNDELIFGSSENTRNERSQIIYALNTLSLAKCGTSFNELCEGKPLTTAITNNSTTQQPDEVLKRLQRIEEKLDAGRIEDRQVAAQLLDALDQNQIEQIEAFQMVTELREWVQEIQQTGLPLNAEVREALDALTEHQGSAYQYLQLALPIIPGILSYNVELGSEHTITLKGIWERFKSRFSKGAKGQAASGSSKVYHGTGKAWAVLVGINHYECDFIHSLKVCVDDVKAIHQALSGGYEVAKLLTDATRADILGGLSTVAQAAAEDDLLLFYFSGHGMAQNGESYLLARDTQLSALKHTAIAMKDIRELIEQSPAHAKVIVLDACHSGASIGKAEPVMTSEFIQRVFEQAEGMAVLASCKENQQSWEWTEKHRSVFTYYLLDALTGKADFEKKGFVTVSDTSNYVSNGVKTWAAQRGVPQTPTLQYTVAGDIILLQYGESHL